MPGGKFGTGNPPVTPPPVLDAVVESCNPPADKGERDADCRNCASVVGKVGCSHAIAGVPDADPIADDVAKLKVPVYVPGLLSALSVAVVPTVSCKPQ